jgi:hypothetical protein
MELTELALLTQDQLVKLIKAAIKLLDTEHLAEVQNTHNGWWDAAK